MPPSRSQPGYILQRPYEELGAVHRYRGSRQCLDDLDLLRHVPGTSNCLVPSHEPDGPSLERTHERTLRPDVGKTWEPLSRSSR